MKSSDNFLKIDTNFIKIYPVVAAIQHLEITQYQRFSAKIRNFKGQYLRNNWSNFNEIRNVCISMHKLPTYQIWSKSVIVVLKSINVLVIWYGMTWSSEYLCFFQLQRPVGFWKNTNQNLNCSSPGCVYWSCCTHIPCYGVSWSISTIVLKVEMWKKFLCHLCH